MQPIEIFRIGTHTAMSGQTLPFDRDALSAAVEAYAPALHEAPIVIGHPKDNHPAFGWIDHLELTDDGVVLAHPKQVDAEFAELVKDGKYKKRSASWYTPDSPANPVPGTLYLRHVGFLGAMPPALKGLGDVQFNEAEEGILEFADTSPYVYATIGKLLRGLREFFIGEKGLDVANTILPDYSISDIEYETQRLLNKSAEQLNNSFSETPIMTPEEIAALKAENEALKAKQSVDFSEKEQSIAQREAALAKREVGSQIDVLITAGKVLPANKAGLVEFMANLEDGEQCIEFGEGDKAVKQSPRKFMTDFLSGLPKIVDFGDHSGGDDSPSPNDLTAVELASKVTAYHQKQAQAGNHISFSEAATAVASGKE